MTTPTRDEAWRERARIADILNERAADPMWDAHAEVSKKLLTKAAELLVASTPAPASGGVDAVAVKALEWHEILTHGGETLSAYFGEWNRRIYLRGVSSREPARSQWIAAEKAKVQAEFEEFIRSALSPAATPVSEAGDVDVREISHRLCNVPGWEYATTTGQRKAWDDADTPPEGEGWKRNVEEGFSGWERFDYHEESYWRRPIPLPASSPADVMEVLNWTERQIRAAKQAMKESAALGNGYANFAAHDAHKHLTTIHAALQSTSTGRVGE